MYSNDPWKEIPRPLDRISSHRYRISIISVFLNFTDCALEKFLICRIMNLYTYPVLSVREMHACIKATKGNRKKKKKKKKASEPRNIYAMA